MKALKNLLVGFAVSFLGSIPLGFLNIIGFEIYSKTEISTLIFYLLGVISVEVFVIYFTLIFASKLLENKRLMKYIEIFSVFFMFLLAYVFYSQSEAKIENQDVLEKYKDYSPYIIGLILSCLNFVQIPFWCGWNLYLVNGNYIVSKSNLKFLYIFATMLGTFFGMLCFVLFLNLVTKSSVGLSAYLMSHIIPLFFIGMGLYQAYKFYKKYFKTKQ
jgi:threonine/homoserine/homoserine lactone efflux protein